MISLEQVSLLTVNATSGLMLGLSASVLIDYISWKWLKAHSWILVLALMLVWIPLVSMGSPSIRRFANTSVNLYLCIMLVVYIKHRYTIRHAVSGVMNGNDTGKSDGRKRKRL